MKLIVSNKATSPWPFRVWLLMKTLGIAFEEEVLDLTLPERKERLKAASPSGRVPVLVDGEVKVWESTAIMEYLAEKRPDLAIWPAAATARAHARSIANEMHAGFAALRRCCVFNTRREPAPGELDDAARQDLARILEIWDDTRASFGAGGPFLYGAFTAADAMYAPIVSRLTTYRIDVPPPADGYMRTVAALPAWREWHE